ncbi:transcriptional regulator [Paenibacillus sp. FSL H7-0326]|uniref:ArsR/SmtB family transcription factor n=1 Tax=Paenibacillus sp. FSL H7-0326 TaxID=1921144 RepID=UPI00096CB4C5|nr:metalloregulator ArsR/SmtB family transcription factor [Paenibacillus sp. FSL H7-0326]OMC67424.1 transcriptional regulator [Paenibacillus sp. FSL H7-0326]
MSQDIEAIANTLKLLSDGTRLTILALLKEKELCVCDLVDLLQTTQPNVSQHLRKLKNGGLVTETKRKQWVYYSLNMDEKPYLQGILDEMPSMKEQIDNLDPDCCR